MFPVALKLLEDKKFKNIDVSLVYGSETPEFSLKVEWKDDNAEKADINTYVEGIDKLIKKETLKFDSEINDDELKSIVD